MPTPPDRRAFLAAVGSAAGGVALGGQPFPPKKETPPPKGKDVLAVLPIDEGLAVPAGARRLGTPRFRVPNYMNAFRLSPDGKTVVAAESDEIRGWELATGKVVFRHKYPDGVSVSAGRITDGNTLTLLVTYNSGNKMEFRRYALGPGALLSKSAQVPGESFDHSAVSRDGKQAALIQRESLRLFDVATGKEVWQEPVSPESIGGIVFTPDGTRLVLAAKEELRVIDVATQKVVRTHRVGDGAKGELNPGRGRSRLSEPVVSPAGDWIACPAGEDDDLVLVWGVKDEVPRHSFKAEKPIAFGPDQKELVTYSKGQATVHDLATGKLVRQVDVVTDDDLALTPDGKVFVANAGDGIVLTDAGTGALLPHSTDPPGLPTLLSFAGGTLRGELTQWRGWVEWDVDTGRHQLIRPPAVHGAKPLALAADRRVALYARDERAEVRDVATGKVLRDGPLPGEDKLAGVLSPDGKTLVLPADGGLTALDVSSDSSRAIRPATGAGLGAVERLVGSPDGRWVAVLAERNAEAGAIDLYDLPAGKYVRRLGFPGTIRDARFSRSGRLLVVAHDSVGGRFGQRATATVFEPASGRTVFKVPSDENNEPSLALSDDDRLLARVEANKRITIWEIRAGQSRSRFAAPGSVSGLAFAPDGRALASSGSGGPVFLWPLFEKSKDEPPTPSDLDRAWAALSGRADEAFEAIRLFASYPGPGLAYLKGKIEPVRPPDAAKLEALIAGLDHREFRKREAASKELGEMGERCRGALEKALADGVSPECRERINKLLAADSEASPANLMMFRAVEAVEHARTPEAAQVLAYWAGGAAGSSLTREASAALKRMGEGKR